jgi:glucuronosyltransferase
MLDNQKYHENAKKWSRIFLENPIHPMDEAMFWIEYVIEHNGADFIKSGAINLKWYQHFLVDVFGAFFGMVGLITVLLVFSIKYVKMFLTGKSYLDVNKKIQ